MQIAVLKVNRWYCCSEAPQWHSFVDLFFVVIMSFLPLFFQVMQIAGIEGEQVVLLLEDHQFVEPQFLELINSLLSAGEVPGLYTPEEVEPLLSPLREMASDDGFRGTLAQFFASREFVVQWNLPFKTPDSLDSFLFKTVLNVK